jgi:hypothetical protein
MSWKSSYRGSITNKKGIYGDMGGLAKGRTGASRNRATNKLVIPRGAAAGLAYMQLHGILSRNPQTGGVGKTVKSKPCNCKGLGKTAEPVDWSTACKPTGASNDCAAAGVCNDCCRDVFLPDECEACIKDTCVPSVDWSTACKPTGASNDCAAAGVCNDCCRDVFLPDECEACIKDTCVPSAD